MPMLRRAALIRRVLALLLILQAVLAPSLCLARASAAGGLAVEICTADGIRVAHLAEDGTERAPGGDASHADGGCLACHALPQAAALPVPALPVPAWIALGAAWAPTGPAAPPPAIRGPPAGARAPPSLLS